jgi:hypothetical protein
MSPDVPGSDDDGYQAVGGLNWQLMLPEHTNSFECNFDARYEL